VSSCTVIW